MNRLLFTFLFHRKLAKAQMSLSMCIDSQSLYSSHTQSMKADVGSDLKQDIPVSQDSCPWLFLPHGNKTCLWGKRLS